MLFNHGRELTPEERSVLEALGDHLEAEARVKIDKTAMVLDRRSNTELSVRDFLFGAAWDIKQIARQGTPSEGI